ncbi:MAG: ORF6N domain-containing protein [Verrucomicrobiota bacterium]|nr:ORF6N domain-containing protein [Verrucomicrobiota bacterium]MDY5596563.1 ORF6N domain-containing protein [Kiritimatiellia bacterium]
MNELTIQELSNSDLIRSRIFTIRGIQVMLDRDLAELYGVATKALNQAVKRNIERFPERYMFQLNKDDVANMRSQIVTLNSDNPGSILRSQIVTSRWGGTRYLPYAFTEHGIIMLASVLNSPTAVEASVRITDTFVAMRRALASIAPLLSRIEATERRQLKLEDSQVRNEERFKLILDAMQDKKFPPQKVFFDGQVYDAFEQMKKFVRMAKKELIIIDPYFADSVLPLIAQKRKDVEVLVFKNSRSKLLHDVDVAQFNAQYANSLTVKVSDRFHDRFLIIDKTTLIHVGASLNHLGKKCFAFSSLDKSNIPDILAKI